MISSDIWVALDTNGNAHSLPRENGQQQQQSTQWDARSLLWDYRTALAARNVSQLLLVGSRMEKFVEQSLGLAETDDTDLEDRIVNVRREAEKSMMSLRENIEALKHGMQKFVPRREWAIYVPVGGAHDDEGENQHQPKKQQKSEWYTNERSYSNEMRGTAGGWLAADRGETLMVDSGVSRKRRAGMGMDATSTMIDFDDLAKVGRTSAPTKLFKPVTLLSDPPLHIPSVAGTASSSAAALRVRSASAAGSGVRQEGSGVGGASFIATSSSSSSSLSPSSAVQRRDAAGSSSMSPLDPSAATRSPSKIGGGGDDDDDGTDELRRGLAAKAHTTCVSTSRRDHYNAKYSSLNRRSHRHSPFVSLDLVNRLDDILQSAVSAREDVLTANEKVSGGERKGGGGGGMGRGTSSNVNNNGKNEGEKQEQWAAQLKSALEASRRELLPLATAANYLEGTDSAGNTKVNTRSVEADEEEESALERRFIKIISELLGQASDCLEISAASFNSVRAETRGVEEYKAWAEAQILDLQEEVVRQRKTADHEVSEAKRLLGLERDTNTRLSADIKDVTTKMNLLKEELEERPRGLGLILSSAEAQKAQRDQREKQAMIEAAEAYKQTLEQAIEEKRAKKNTTEANSGCLSPSGFDAVHVLSSLLSSNSEIPRAIARGDCRGLARRTAEIISETTQKASDAYREAVRRSVEATEEQLRESLSREYEQRFITSIKERDESFIQGEQKTVTTIQGELAEVKKRLAVKVDPLSAREGYSELVEAATALTNGPDEIAELQNALREDDVVTIVALCIEALERNIELTAVAEEERAKREAAKREKEEEDLSILPQSEALIERLREELRASRSTIEALREQLSLCEEENEEQARVVEDLSERLKSALEESHEAIERLKEAHANELRSTEERCLEAVKKSHPELERERALTRELTETIKVLQQECGFCRRAREV